MNRPSSFFGIRFSLILLLTLGMLSASMLVLPYETLAGWLNRLAADGSFESFTPERFDAVRAYGGWSGLAVALVTAVMLFRWVDVRALLERLAAWWREYRSLVKNDAREFWRRLSLRRWDRTDLLIVAGITLAAALIRLANLNIPMVHDEAYTYNAFASRSLWVTLSDYHLPNNHVLLTVWVNILVHLFGNHLWLMRLTPFLAGVTMVPVTYVLGRRFYSREAGMLAAALVAVFPPLVEYSALARGYVPMCLGTLLIIILGDHVRGTKDRFAWLTLAVVSALGFFTIPIMFFSFGSLYLWLFVSWLIGDVKGYESKFDFFKYWLVSGVLTMALTGFLYLPILVNNFELFFRNKFVLPMKWNLFKAALTARWYEIWDEWFHFTPDWLVALGIAGLVASLLFHWKISKQKFPLLLAYLIVVGSFLVLRRPSMMTRMWLFIVPPLLVWSAGGMIESLRWLARGLSGRVPLHRVFLGVSLAAVFVAGLVALPTIPARLSAKSSVEQAVLYLKDNLREGDIVTSSVEYFPVVRYYFGVYSVPQDYLRREGAFRRAFMVVGLRGDTSLENIVPDGETKRSGVNLDTVRIVLQFDDLTLYEGDPVP